MMWFSVLSAVLWVQISKAQIQCNATILGSTTEHGYEDFNIYISSNSSNYNNNSFIRFNTCSTQTNFDTLLYLYNNDKTTIIDSCDDYCSIDAPYCFQNERAVHQTVWDILVHNLSETQYIFEVNGYNGQRGSYQLRVSYPCDHNIVINSTTPIYSTYATKTNTTIVIDLDVDSDTTSSDASWQMNPLVIIVTLPALCFCSIVACCACIGYSNEHGIGRIFYGPIEAAEKAPMAAHVLKILFQVIVSGCSIIGSLALSNSLGLSNYDNGLMAITMGSTSVLLACWKQICNWGDMKRVGQSEANIDEEDIGILGGTIMGATITDAAFDILQGIAAIRNEEYTALSATMLVTATWMGVGEEIIEAVFEIGSIVCIECVEKLSDASKYGAIIVNWIIHISALIELCFGIYIFSTFNASVYMYIGISVQILFLLIATIWICVGQWILCGYPGC
eukprot:43407_1